MPITGFLEQNARLYGEEIALTEINPEKKTKKQVSWKEYALIEQTDTRQTKRELTWKAFDEEADKVAGLLVRLGMKKGEKAAILMMNCLEYLPVYFGILKAGIIVVPLNFRYSAEEICYCADLADVSVLFFGPEFNDRVKEAGDKLTEGRTLISMAEGGPSCALSFASLTREGSAGFSGSSITDEDYAAIYFSSGTTGFPKAILHRHRALMHAALTEQDHHGQTHEDVFLCIPPLYHTGAKMHWFGSLMTGGRAVLLKGTDPEVILRTVSEEHCTIVWLLVPWAQDILDALDKGRVKAEDYELRQWRLMHIGAQPVPPSLIRHWKDYFPLHDYDTNYGLSESTGPGCVHLGLGHEHKIGAIGIPGYGWQVKIIGEDGRTLPHCREGELCVKGPGVMDRYYKNPEATKEVLTKDGWLLTGDIAVQDEDGYYFLVDRKKDVIVSGGENLYPVQIEDFLRTCPKVHDAAVIGLPDRRLGEIAAAVIELKAGETASEEEIEAFCSGLPRYKRPKKIFFAHVPRNATGKIEKPALRTLYGADKLVAREIQCPQAKVCKD